MTTDTTGIVTPQERKAKRVRTYTPKQMERRQERNRARHRNLRARVAEAKRASALNGNPLPADVQNYIHYHNAASAKSSKKHQDGRNKKKASRYASDAAFRLKTLLSNRIRCAMYSSGHKKNFRTSELIGCTISHLAEHLESQFAPGMTWNNRSEWHIDHIKPCASFDLTDPDQQRMCFHWSNLRPLFAYDNRSKRDRMDWVPSPDRYPNLKPTTSP